MSATLTLEAPRERRAAAPLIRLERVETGYRTGKLEYPALRGVDLEIESGGLLGTVLIALLIMRIPFRRAVRLKPGEAIRYA